MKALLNIVYDRLPEMNKYIIDDFPEKKVFRYIYINVEGFPLIQEKEVLMKRF